MIIIFAFDKIFNILQQLLSPRRRFVCFSRLLLNERSECSVAQWYSVPAVISYFISYNLNGSTMKDRSHNSLHWWLTVLSVLLFNKNISFLSLSLSNFFPFLDPSTYLTIPLLHLSPPPFFGPSNPSPAPIPLFSLPLHPSPFNLKHQLPLVFTLSPYFRPHFTFISPTFHPPFTHLSPSFCPPFTLLLPSFHPPFTHLSPSFALLSPSIALLSSSITLLLPSFRPPFALSSGRCLEQSLKIWCYLSNSLCTSDYTRLIFYLSMFIPFYWFCLRAAHWLSRLTLIVSRSLIQGFVLRNGFMQEEPMFFKGRNRPQWCSG